MQTDLDPNKNKYYIPTIDEFYVGFEFESIYTGFSKDFNWKQVIIKDSQDLGYFGSLYEDDAIESEFRVKYLDEEDIESLGWSEKLIEWTTNKITTLEYILWNAQIKMIPLENNIYQIIKLSGKVFEGTINNKSELKKLMKQLNIDNQHIISNII